MEGRPKTDLDCKILKSLMKNLGGNVGYGGWLNMTWPQTEPNFIDSYPIRISIWVIQVDLNILELEYTKSITKILVQISGSGHIFQAYTLSPALLSLLGLIEALIRPNRPHDFLAAQSDSSLLFYLDLGPIGDPMRASCPHALSDGRSLDPFSSLSVFFAWSELQRGPIVPIP